MEPFDYGQPNFLLGEKKDATATARAKLIVAMVVSMMLMGIILAHISVFQVVQVLHVGMTAILLAVTWHWIMRLYSLPTDATEQ